MLSVCCINIIGNITTANSHFREKKTHFAKDTGFQMPNFITWNFLSLELSLCKQEKCCLRFLFFRVVTFSVVQRRNLVRLQELPIENMSQSQFGIDVICINF